jgi:hypothetical protein
MKKKTKIFVLDTSVLIHDHHAIINFKQHEKGERSELANLALINCEFPRFLRAAYEREIFVPFEGHE